MEKSLAWAWGLFIVYFVFLIWLSRRGHKKTSSLKDFIVAPKAYGPVTIALALGATSCSAAALMGNPGLAFSLGWPSLWYALASVCCIYGWFISGFKLSQVGSRIGSKSLPDFLAIRFQSDFLRGFAAIVTLILIYYVAGQFAGIGWAFQNILGVSYSKGIIFASIIITLYIMVGGTHADIMNCALQGVFMIATCLLVIFTVYRYVGDIPTINSLLTAKDPNMSWDLVFKEPNFGLFTVPAILAVFTLNSLTPQLSKLWFSLKKEKDIPLTILLVTGFLFMISMLMLVGGLGAKAAIAGKIPADTATIEVVKMFMPAPIIAIVGVGILSAIMSTLAGLFLVMAVAVSNDLFRDIIIPRMKNKMDKEEADKMALLGTRIMIPIIMVIGLIIAYNPPPLLTQLIWVGLGGFIAGVGPVMLVGCLWRGATKTAACLASVVGFVGFLILYFIVGRGMGVAVFAVPWGSAFAAVIAGFVVVIGVSFVTQPLPKEHLDKIFIKRNQREATR